MMRSGWPAFLLASGFFYILAASPLYGQKFHMVDLERLLLQHPLMRQFDPETGRFRGTPSEVRSPESIRKEVAELQRSMAEGEALIETTIQKTLLDSHRHEDTERAWATIREQDARISEQKREVGRLSRLLRSGGIPGIETLFDVVDGLVIDVLSSIRKNASETSLILNSGWRDPASPPDIKAGSAFRSFIGSPDPKDIHAYLTQVTKIGTLFRARTQPVLYQKEKVGP
jgi:hypothetical protein